MRDVLTPSATVRRALAVAIQCHASVLVWGAPGEGKSQMVESLARQLGRPCEVVVGSVREATDFAGLPVRDETGVSFAPPAWARRAADAGDAVVFLDELTTAAPQVQAAMLRIVLDREVGDLALPAGVAVVAAANPPEVAADGYELAAPLANRFCHLDWSADVNEWITGMVSHWPDPDIPIVPPPEERDDDGARWTAVVTSFIKHRPSMLRAFPTDPFQQGRAWPTPRSWDMAIRLAAAADAAGAEATVRKTLVAGCVGRAAAKELETFLVAADLPDPDALLADPSGLKLPERGDLAFTCLNAVVAHVASRPTEARWLAAWEVLAAAAAQGRADLAATMARTLVKVRDPDAAWATPLAAADLLPVLRDAGVA